MILVRVVARTPIRLYIAPETLARLQERASQAALVASSQQQ
jgi:hypothetical protein